MFEEIFEKDVSIVDGE